MDLAKKIVDLVDAVPLSDGDYLPVSQPNAFNPATGVNGDTRKVTVRKMAEYAAEGLGALNSAPVIDFPPENAAPENNKIYPVPYTYKSEATVYNLNDFRTVGDYTLAYPASGSSNFPDGWGTGTGNAAVLKVRPFASNTAVRQELYKRGTNRVWSRYSASATSWSAWVELNAASSVSAANNSVVVGTTNNNTTVSVNTTQTYTNLPIGAYVIAFKEGNIPTEIGNSVVIRTDNYMFRTGSEAGILVTGNWIICGCLTICGTFTNQVNISTILLARRAS